MYFACVEDGVKNRFLDLSHQAIESPFFPVSVGLRSQALKLKFVSPDLKGNFLAPGLSIKNAMEFFNCRFISEIKETIFYQEYIGDSLSIIYSPFYFDKKLYDAVLNQPLNCDSPDKFDVAELKGESPDWKIKFLPGLCPECGWDLEGEKDSIALLCKNCGSLWRPKKDGYNKLNFGKIPAKDDDIAYLPFWRIKAEISGIKLDTYADLVAAANLPKVIQKGFEEMDFRFWIMAFKVQPQKFLSIATAMTLSQPQEDLAEGFPDKKIFPVTLSLSDVVEGLKLILANFVKPQKMIFPKLRDIKITPKSFILVYVPFKEKQHEFIHTKYPMSIIKNHLIMARNL
jgi:hypothetical protein